MIGIILDSSLIASVMDVFQKAGRCAFDAAPCCLSTLCAQAFRSSCNFSLAALPYEAFYSLDAIVRTTWRMLVTHRQLLEWNPSGDPERTSHNNKEGLVACIRQCALPRRIAQCHGEHACTFGQAVLAVALAILWPLVFSPPLSHGRSAGASPAAEQGLTAEQTFFSGSFPEDVDVFRDIR